MNGNELSATTAGGSQDATQSPQSAGAGNFLPGESTSAVQSGTAQAALEKSTAIGVPLGSATPNAVTLANLPKTASSATTKEPVKEVHTTSPVAAISSIVFVVIAVVLIWSAVRPAKNTTD